ncbi:g7181 [Coccomyxa viridis]|uniref:G7181 protein n=1 Tax=Coccomyxa viridis TaxID=1274662 RepID=A0ABP1G3S0_9CHLO
MGVLMGRGGFWVPNTCDVHDRKISLRLNVGDRRYRGGIHCSLAPNASLGLYRLIRVGFLHKKNQQDNNMYLAANGQQVAAVQKDGGSDEASKAIPLSHNYPQAAMAMLAAVAVNDLPLDLVMTDGKEYILYRFRNNRLLEYDNLSGRQAYFVIAEGLKHHAQLKTSGDFLSKEILGSVDPSMREAHLTLKRRGAKP